MKTAKRPAHTATAASPEMLAARMGLRSSSAASAIPSHKARRQNTRSTRRDAAMRDWR